MSAPGGAPAERIRVGVLFGADDNRSQLDEAEFAVDVLGNSDVLQLLRMLDPNRFRISLLHISPGYFGQALRWNLGKLDLVWNIVSDPDQNPLTLAVAEKMTAGSATPVIDPPGDIWRTRRHEIAERLQGLADVRAPKALLIKDPTPQRLKVAADEAGLRFPAIIRRAGTHNGEVLGVFGAPDEAQGVFGGGGGACYVTEFVDVRRADGLYRKSRFFFIGDRIVLRQHIVHDDWNIHGRSSRGFMAARDDLLEESRSALLGGLDALPARTRAALHAIRERVGLDYFGLDACVDPDGGLVVFEANATMNFHTVFSNPKTQHNRAALPPALRAIERLILTKTGRPAAA